MYCKAALPASRDALIPGTPFHASAEVPCVSGNGAKAARCKASVIRRANSSATVRALRCARTFAPNVS